MQRSTAAAPPEVRTAWGLLGVISDPEVPVLIIIDLGMVCSAECCGDGWVIGFMSMYSGCSATGHLLDEIRTVMAGHGYTPVRIVLQLGPPWTTDWMSPDARERLRQYGIGPPQAHACHAEVPTDVQCPRCASIHTSLISEFGFTACKVLYRCDSRRESFDYFECI